MKTDIYQKIVQDFGNNSKQAIELILEIDAHTKGLISDETTRAMIFVANGNVDTLSKFLSNGIFRIDDIINHGPKMAKEYDFKKTFHQLKML